MDGNLYHYRAIVDRWIDGDTVSLDVDLGFYMNTQQRFRIARIDAFETRGEERQAGLLVKEYVQTQMPDGSEVIISTTKTGKYGRWIAELWYTDIESGLRVNLSDDLLDKGFAVLYG